MEWVLALPMIPLGCGMIAGTILAFARAAPNSVEPATTAPLSPLVRAELEQTPRWWDDQFHRLLVACGAEYREFGEVEYIEQRSLAGPDYVQTIPAPRAYLGCTCQHCKGVQMTYG